MSEVEVKSKFSETLQVAGSGSIVFSLPDEPSQVYAEFSDGENNLHPTCVSVPLDTCQAEAIYQGNWIVRLGWNVADKREVTWTWKR